MKRNTRISFRGKRGESIKDMLRRELAAAQILDAETLLSLERHDEATLQKICVMADEWMGGVL